MVRRRELLVATGSVAACALLGISPPVFAHTSVPETIHCPVDAQSFEVNETASYTTLGGYRDFAKRGSTETLYEDMVHVCPACHFAGYAEDFRKAVAPATKQWVLGPLRSRYGSRRLSPAEGCEAAALRYEFERADNRSIANLYLAATYILRPAKGGAEEAERKEDQRLAAKFLLQALTSGETQEEDRGVLLYLAGEMHRRVGAHTKALACYDLAARQKGSPPWLDSVIREQRALAEKDDANNDI